ncbi:MAG: zinc ribbon domain-containing protein [Myxococcota bacterium]
MPTYDYQCQKCEFEFEREQRITENPIKTCPKCKSRRAKRLLSASNFILKGGGWYADGYGSTGGKKSSEGGESQSDASDSSSSSTKDESKSKGKSKDASSKKASSEKASASGSSSQNKAS